MEKATVKLQMPFEDSTLLSTVLLLSPYVLPTVVFLYLFRNIWYLCWCLFRLSNMEMFSPSYDWKCILCWFGFYVMIFWFILWPYYVSSNISQRYPFQTKFCSFPYGFFISVWKSSRKIYFNFAHKITNYLPLN